MRIERERNGGAALDRRRLHDRVQQRGMPAMLAIKVADGEYGARGLFVLREPSRNFHSVISSTHWLRSRAASFAKYVRMRSAPARLMDTKDSMTARDSSNQPALAAALIMLYSPLT